MERTCGRIESGSSHPGNNGPGTNTGRSVIAFKPAIPHEGPDDIDAQAEMRRKVTDAMQRHFRPEFLNRLDESIIFHSLKQEELRQIVELQVQRLAKRLEDKKLSLQLNADALDWLAGVGYDPVYGARPLKRAIQRELETPIAKGILGGEFTGGHTVAVDVEAGKLRFQQMDPSKLPVLV